MVDYVSDSNELARKIRAWSFSPDGNVELKDRVQRIPGVTADLICEAGEILYAHYDVIDDEAKRVMAEVFNYADNQGWTTYNKGTRSKEIIAVAAYDLGDTTVKPKKVPEPEANRRNGEDWTKKDAPVDTTVTPPAPAPTPANPKNP